MSEYLRHTTFKDGEFEAEARRRMPHLTDATNTATDAATATGGAPITKPVTKPALVLRAGRLLKLLKSHDYTVAYPDGSEGTCRYERLGPIYHRFDYRYADSAAMPRQYSTRPLGNTPADIEAKAREMAEDCYRDAIRQERRDYFSRATPPTDGSRKPDPAKYRMGAGQAQKLGGKYALCLRMPGGRLIKASKEAFETLEAANAAWCAQGHLSLVVACCSRLDRDWQIPKYNPLYKEHDMRRTERIPV